MKKILALALTLTMVLSLAACGGGNDPKPSGNDTPPPPSTTQPDNDAPLSRDEGDAASTAGDSDWQKIIKDTYGFDLTMPEGWVYQEVDDFIGHEFSFEYTGSDFKADYDALCQQLFELTAAVTADRGNYLYGNGDYPAIDEIPSTNAGSDTVLTPVWSYNFGASSIQIALSDFGDSATIGLLIEGDAH